MRFAGVDGDRQTRKLIPAALLNQRDDLRWRRLLDLLQVESASHLSKPHVVVSTLQLTRIALSEKLLVPFGIGSIERFQPSLGLLTGNRVGKLYLRTTAWSDEQQIDNDERSECCVA